MLHALIDVGVWVRSEYITKPTQDQFSEFQSLSLSLSGCSYAVEFETFAREAIYTQSLSLHSSKIRIKFYGIVARHQT